MLVKMNCANGGGYSKKLLWTNPSPNATFYQTVTLDNNEEWTNYDMLGVTFKAYTGYKTLCSVYIDITNPLTMRAKAVHAGDSTNAYGLVCAVYSWWSSEFTRGFRLADDATDGTKKIVFFNCYQIGGSASTAYNNYLIPQEIYGFKFNDNEWKLPQVEE